MPATLEPAVGMLVTPKPFTFGRYTNVTPGKPYRVERTMTAAEWFREPADGWFMLLTDDKNEHYWYGASQFAELTN